MDSELVDQFGVPVVVGSVVVYGDGQVGVVKKLDLVDRRHGPWQKKEPAIQVVPASSTAAGYHSRLPAYAGKKAPGVWLTRLDRLIVLKHITPAQLGMELVPVVEVYYLGPEKEEKSEEPLVLKVSKPVSGIFHNSSDDPGTLIGRLNQAYGLKQAFGWEE